MLFFFSTHFLVVVVVVTTEYLHHLWKFQLSIMIAVHEIEPGDRSTEDTQTVQRSGNSAPFYPLATEP